jgi:hypothetical protein
MPRLAHCGIHALDRLDPVLPLSPGRAERHGFEYYRHGTLSLYAALNTSTGEVFGQTVPRHTVNDSPLASIRITWARRASSARILRLRTRRFNSVRSSTVSVSAIWRWIIRLSIQWIQSTSSQYKRVLRSTGKQKLEMSVIPEQSFAATNQKL